MRKNTAKPETAKQQLGARVPVELYKRLAHYRVDRRAQISDLVAEALDEYLKKRSA